MPAIAPYLLFKPRLCIESTNHKRLTRALKSIRMVRRFKGVAQLVDVLIIAIVLALALVVHWKERPMCLP